MTVQILPSDQFFPGSIKHLYENLVNTSCSMISALRFLVVGFGASISLRDELELIARDPCVMTVATLHSLPLQNCRFERFGTAIMPVEDMTPHSEVDAQLKFEGADLRYYVMRLRHRPPVLASMTRHQRATQCLGSADAQPWWLAVAAPELLPEELSSASVQLVQVAPGEAVKLHQGTWHAGPFFNGPLALFYNLELTDTNLTDHNFQALVTPLNLILN